MAIGTLRLAVEADGAGAHPAAWRNGDGAAGTVPVAVDPGAIRNRVTAAERAGFAFATFGDGPLPPPSGARIEAGTRAAFLSRLTRTIGLAPTLHIATTEPFHLATQLASLDHATGGRAAWVVGAANDAAARATIGAVPLADDALAQEVRDVIDVARALWDSWEDDAVIKDVATGRFIDNDKVHHVRFSGASFSVVGPLITPRPPQGQVVVIAPDGLGVAGRADITLVGGPGVPAVAARAARAREGGSPLVFAEVEVALDTASSGAASRVERLDAEQAWEPGSRLRFTGAASELAGLLSELSAHVDGVLFYPAETAVDLPVLGGEVLPALATSGLGYVPGSDDRTLRDILGLPRPANRFAAGPAGDLDRSALRA